jgi:mRNA interferase RelE/StbE
MFEIEWKAGAQKELLKLEPSIAKRIFNKVDELKENTFSKDISRLKGRNEFKLRIGDYRVLFFIEGNKLSILRIGHRKNIYDF